MDRAAVRLEKAGLVEAIEREQTCCYANQSKVWAIDPEGRRWEIYVVHEDTEERGSAERLLRAVRRVKRLKHVAKESPCGRRCSATWSRSDASITRASKIA